jgi:serine/threonine-protein kinase
MIRREGGADGPLFAGGAPMSFTPDGRFLIFGVEGGATGLDLMIMPVSESAKGQPLLHQDFDQIDARIAPNGRWLAYMSNESGIFEVFVRPLTRDPSTGMPVPGPSVLVSSGGAVSPRWRQDGRELFYQSRAGSIMAVKVDDASVGPPTELFRAPPGIQSEWSVSAEGDRFLVAAPIQRTAPAFTVVVNWQSSLATR